MPFCPNCGTQNSGSFCTQCGTPIPAAPGSSGGFAAPPQSAAATGLSDNVAGALCYVLGLITGILFLAITPYNQNPRVRFHAWQSVLLTVAWCVFWFALAIVTGFMHFLALLLIPVEMLIGFAGFCLWLFLMWKAYNGEIFEVPVIGGIARQQAGL